MAWKSILKPENSAVAGIATVGGVFAIYQLNLGSLADVQATEANHPITETSRKKAAYTSFALVAGLVLVTKDANIGILGWGSIIVMELLARHSIMAHPDSGRMMDPKGGAAVAYAPAENVVPMWSQAETG